MESEVARMDQDNKQLILSAIGLAITADCWSSFNADTGRLTITGLIVGVTTNSRHNVILVCIALGYESHSADLIAHHIRCSLSKLNIEKSLVCAMVADGASNMKRAAANFNVK
ncbi:unnamed protein product [Cylicocyclus nassatus]|uniref:Uncharacterized protein n=1 Tax=Cylicocyclus nassatus TaxID=53992 RepID=A0AA36DLX4_CYLNA|nr:unnamed protein product [Cylicocyclus nassatus]